MKNILIMLDYYLPNASPNGICVSKVINELKKKYNVFLLCINKDNKEVLHEKGIKTFEIKEKKEKKKNLFTKILYHLKWLYPISKTPPYVRENILNDLYIEADKIIADNHIDMIVAVHLPIETLIAGIRLKEKYPSIILTSYMLDSFSGGVLPRGIPECLSRHSKIIWEKNILNHYDYIFLMNSSKKHHEKYTANYKWYKNAKYLDIPMLIKKEKTNSKKKDTIKLLYTGSLNMSQRNPSTMIKVLACLNDDNVYCEFVGTCNCKEYFTNLKGLYGERLTFTSQIPYKEIDKKINEADILLNIGNSNISLIPSKIFEYMSYEKPIISTYDISLEPSIEYLEKYPLAILIDGREEINADNIRKQVKEILNKKYSSDAIYKTFEKNVPAYFVKIIDEIFEVGEQKNEGIKDR